MNMSTHLTIDLVADLSCPWCALGLATWLAALERLPSGVSAHLRCQPFELNPHLPEGGQDLLAHLQSQGHVTPDKLAQVRATLVQRGAELGFEFPPQWPARIYNTRKAQRLLFWAGQAHPERQLALHMALLRAYHQTHLPIDADDVLLNAAEDAGLDREHAMDVLASEAYTTEVQEQMAVYTQAGIRSVPTAIVNGRYVVAGCQPLDVLEPALQQMADELAQA